MHDVLEDGQADADVPLGEERQCTESSTSPRV